MSRWCAVEVYATFMKISGEVEVLGAERLSDSVNRSGDHIDLRAVRTEPLSVDYPVLSRLGSEATVSKAAVVLICPDDSGGTRNPGMVRAKASQAVAINTQAFSLVADVHLEPGRRLRDHLDRVAGEFLPLTNVSALWVAALSAESRAIQRPFALLNTALVLSFSLC